MNRVLYTVIQIRAFIIYFVGLKQIRIIHNVLRGKMHFWRSDACIETPHIWSGWSLCGSEIALKATMDLWQGMIIYVEKREQTCMLFEASSVWWSTVLVICMDCQQAHVDWRWPLICRHNHHLQLCLSEWAWSPGHNMNGCHYHLVVLHSSWPAF